MNASRPGPDMSLMAAGARVSPLDGRHLVALALPVALPAAMSATFVVARSLGHPLGYIADSACTGRHVAGSPSRSSAVTA
jgi:hypothetical protein